MLTLLERSSSRRRTVPGHGCPAVSMGVRQRILITGSEGLVGSALRTALEARGAEVVGLDLLGAGCEQGDVCDLRRVRDALRGCDGAVHLAAVSRVIRGEHDPKGCWRTNVGGLCNLLQVIDERKRRPWLLFASSREVYGTPRRLPATEETSLRPVNVYGRSKTEGERLVDDARSRGLCAAVVRLSNVYGRTRDHADRVIPAFLRAAIAGRPLRVDGAQCTFDFTHIDDTVRGMVAVADRLARGQGLPPIHLVTGRPTALGGLAALAVALAGGGAPIAEAPPRSFDVARFHGSPERARKLLGWVPHVDLQDGLERLLRDLRAETGEFEQREATP